MENYTTVLKQFGSKDRETIPTGIDFLDVILSGKGMPIGAYVELYSEPGLGKSTIAMHIAKKIIEQGNTVAYLDVERGLNENIIRTMGLTKYKDKEFLTLYPTTHDDIEDILLSEEFKKHMPKLIIIDSMTSLVPPKLMEQKVSEVVIGMKARLDSGLFQKYKAYCLESNVTFIFITQMRYKSEGQGRFMRFFKDSSGGDSVKHFYDIRLRLKRMSDLKRKERGMGRKEEAVYGAEIQMWCEKNKWFKPFVPVVIPIIFGRGVSNVLSYVILLKGEDLATSTGSYFKIKIPGMEQNVKGNKGLLDFVKANTEAVRTYLKENGYFNFGEPL